MNELSAELADIVEPLPVVTQGSHAWLVMVIAILLLFSVLVIVRWWLHSKHRRRTLRRLRQLRRDVSSGHMNTRALAYAIAFELRAGLQTHRLSTLPVKIGDESQRNAWHVFVSRLDILRYQPGSELDPTQVDALLREAISWARRSR